MGHARALSRALALAAWTAAWFLLRLGVPPLRRVRPRLGEAAHARSVRAWARGVARLAGMRVRVEGEPPRPPFLLVSNHVSYIDIIALWTRAEGDFLAKAEIARWPVFGRLARSGGTVFVDRTRAAELPEVIAKLEGILSRRRGVIVFPEGTSSDGSRVLPFRPPLFEVAARSGYPVHCAAISYVTRPGEPPARLSVCWWGDMGFLDHLYRLLMLSSFEARIVFLPGRVQGADRKELAENAQSRVSSAFTPVTGSPSQPSR